MIERQVKEEDRQATLPSLVKKVIHDYMRIEKIPKETSIILSIEKDKAKEPELYRIKDIGPGHWEFGKFIETTLKVGDVVFIMGPSAAIDYKGKIYQFARARDVVAIF